MIDLSTIKGKTFRRYTNKYGLSVWQDTVKGFLIVNKMVKLAQSHYYQPVIHIVGNKTPYTIELSEIVFFNPVHDEK